MIRIALAFAVSLALSACLGTRHTQVPSSPQGNSSTPNKNAKTAPYEVFGERYYPISSADGYQERGVASWYGGKFHGRLTANGERYDMHQFTAAHKTLPLPTWVKVTNLRNGTAVTVRVNDRGPFVKNRLIDVSYAAAIELGMVENGTTLVEVEVLDKVIGRRPAYAEPPIEVMTSATVTATGPPATELTQDPAAVANDEGAIIYVQVGAFGDQENALRMQANLHNSGIGDVRVSDGDMQGLQVHRVQIGPVASVDYYDTLITQLDSLGIRDTHLVTK